MTQSAVSDPINNTTKVIAEWGFVDGKPTCRIVESTFMMAGYTMNRRFVTETAQDDAMGIPAWKHEQLDYALTCLGREISEGKIKIAQVDR